MAAAPLQCWRRGLEATHPRATSAPSVRASEPRAPPYKAAPVNIPDPPPLGDFSLSAARREEERGRRRSWGRGNWRPPVGEPEVAAPLDPHVADRPAGEAA
jgi:hypothetical protein